MSSVHDKSLFYTLLRSYSDSCFPLAYHKVEYAGLERIPTDGAVIFAPNHTNALMDALSVSKVSKPPIVYVARADIFRKPLIAKFLNLLKIMPIVRIRDGVSNLKRNAEIMECAVEALRAGLHFCIMAEGTQRAKHSLLPLVKGIFRIALQANEAIGNSKPVYIVPMGIEYGDYFRYRSTVLLNIGEPINVTEFVRTHADLEVPEQINQLREKLTEAMRQQILYIPDNENYNAILELTYLLYKRQLQLVDNKAEGKLKARLSAAQQIVATCSQSKKNGVPIAEVLKLANEFFSERKRLEISKEAIENYPFSKWSLFGKGVLLLVTLPYFLFSAVATLPVTALYTYLCSVINDREFNNSIRFGITALVMPLWWLVVVFLLAAFLPISWAVAVVVLMLPAHIFLHDYLRWWRVWISEIKLLKYKTLTDKIEQLNHLYFS